MGPYLVAIVPPPQTDRPVLPELVELERMERHPQGAVIILRLVQNRPADGFAIGAWLRKVEHEGWKVEHHPDLPAATHALEAQLV